MNQTAVPSNHLLQLLVFVGVSTIFILTQYLFFQGFNGGDDLHYTWLAARFVQGTYSPFRIDDIFSGRIILVAIQALAYKAGGINVFTSQVVSYLAVLTCCYLTVFRLLSATNCRTVLIASTLFYFNPVLSGIILGPAPDPLIMLAGVVILLLLNKKDENFSRKNAIAIGTSCGALIFCTLLIKESGLVFLPFVLIVIWMRFGRQRMYAAAAVVITFSVSVLGIGLLYRLYTGDFFFRIRQITYSFYPNPCYFSSFLNKEMAVRLTYGVWHNFLASGFFTVLLASLILLFRFTGIFGKKHRRLTWYEGQFLILLVLALYFPFSFKDYQPLCHKPRHFLFLLPLAVAICTPYFEEPVSERRKRFFHFAVAGLLAGLNIYYFLDGRFWVITRCLLIWSVFLPFSISRVLAGAAYYLLALVLWLQLSYRFFYLPTNWYSGLSRLESSIGGRYFYLPDHDNVMHWKLLKHFDTSVHVFDFDLKPYNDKPYPYYDSLRFHPGWFIVNKQYNERTKNYLARIDSLKNARFFDSTVHSGPVEAYYFSRPQQFTILQRTMLQEKSKNCNCY